MKCVVAAIVLAVGCGVAQVKLMQAFENTVLNSLLSVGVKRV